MVAIYTSILYSQGLIIILFSFCHSVTMTSTSTAGSIISYETTGLDVEITPQSPFEDFMFNTALGSYIIIALVILAVTLFVSTHSITKCVQHDKNRNNTRQCVSQRLQTSAEIKDRDRSRLVGCRLFGVDYSGSHFSSSYF